MADKFLSEAEWKKFAKGRDLKDAALLKALVAFEKARDGAAQVDALATIEKEIDGLRKFVKGDRDFGAQLDAMEKAQGKEEKLAKAAAAKESEASEDEDEESPAQLTGKLIPLLRELKKGEDELPVMIAVGGKEAAVLISRRAISPSKRKMLAEYLGDSGTPKYVIGHCVWEANSYTFVVQSQAGGLAKKLRAAIYKQTDLRAKVRVRGEDGAMDDDGEEGEAGEHESGETPDAPPTTTPTQATTGTIPPAPPLPDALKAQFDKRWATLEPLALAALRAGTGDVSKIRAVAEFVREKADGANYKSALQAADSLEKLLSPAQQGEPQQTPAPKTEGADPAAAFNARLAALLGRAKPLIAAGGAQGQDLKLKLSEAGMSARKQEFGPANALLDAAEALLEKTTGGAPETKAEAKPEAGAAGGGVSKVAFTQSRLAWIATRKQVQAELKKLELKIQALTVEEEDFGEIRAGTGQLYEIMEVLDERLIDKLDDALNAAEPARIKALHGEAREIIDEYLDFVNTDDLMKDIDDNGFVNVKIRSALSDQLKQMSTLLGASFARY